MLASQADDIFRHPLENADKALTRLVRGILPDAFAVVHNEGERSAVEGHSLFQQIFIILAQYYSMCEEQGLQGSDSVAIEVEHIMK